MMKPLFKPTCAIPVLLAAVLSTPAISDDGASAQQPAGPTGGDNPNIGIKYDKKQGLYVTPFSAKLLGFETAEVEEREITKTLVLQLQVYDVSDSGTAWASAWVPQDELASVMPGMTVELERDFDGEITGVKRGVNGQGEVLLEIAVGGGTLRAGEFLSGEVDIGSEGEVVVVPAGSVVNSAEGKFAYVDNGGWMTRATVETGAEEGGMVEIVDGLYAGDVIATSPVMTLWMTELALLKSGRA